jgi:hypothetical protein
VGEQTKHPDPSLTAEEGREGKVATSSVVLFFVLLSAFIATLELRVHVLESAVQQTVSNAPVAHVSAITATDEAITPRL